MSASASPVRFLCANRTLALLALAPFHKKNLKAERGTLPWPQRFIFRVHSPGLLQSEQKEKSP